MWRRPSRECTKVKLMVRLLALLHARPSNHSGSYGEEEGEGEAEEARRAQEPRTCSKTSNEAGAKAAPPSQEPFASARPFLLRQKPLSQQSVEQLFALSVAIPQQSVALSVESVAIAIEPFSLPLQPLSFQPFSQLQRIAQLFPVAELQSILLPLSKLQPIAQPILFQSWPKMHCLFNNHAITTSSPVLIFIHSSA